jgi:acetoin utilization protein AcuC
VRCVPRTWTHLLAEATGNPIDPATAVPSAWHDYVRGLGARGQLPHQMGEGREPDPIPWVPGGESWLDRAIGATRRAAFPLLGLDPDDPRD